MRNLMTGCLLAAFLCAASCGCSKDNGGGEEGGQVAGVTVKPAYNKSEVLHNPLNGWVMYVSADYDPSYFDKEIYVPLLGKNVRVADYASACYIRTKWSVLNPADGQYAWKDPDSKVYKLVQKARELKLPIAFRVVVDGRDQGANTPQFVYDAGAEYAMSEPKYPDRKTPMPQDPIFQRYYEKFVAALAEEFNDPEYTSFIDGYGLGKWGEGHSVAYNKDDVSAVDENTETVKREVLDWITKLYAKHFTKVPLVINYHRVLGHPTSQGTANPNSESLVALAISVRQKYRRKAALHAEIILWKETITKHGCTCSLPYCFSECSCFIPLWTYLCTRLRKAITPRHRHISASAVTTIPTFSTTRTSSPR